MTRDLLKILITTAKVLALVCVVATWYSVATAQMRPPSTIDGQGTNDETRLYTSMEEERRVKREIQAAEKAYKENLTRARDLAFISASLVKEFEGKNHLDREDMKNLEKAEKLAKNIREASGGSKDEVELKERPGNLSSALCRVSEVAQSLKLKVEKTPKRVISAAVIDEANVLLELISIVRSLQPKV